MGFKRYQLNARVVQDLKKRSTIGIVFYLMVVCLVLFADGYYYRHPGFAREYMFWVSLICLFRLIHLPVARLTKQRFEKLNNHIFLASVALTALIWGVGFAKFLLQEGEAPTRFMMTVCSIGLCAGGVVAFVPDIRLCLVFLILFLMPADLTLFATGIDRPLAIAIFMFVIYLCFIAVRSNRDYWDALESEHLLAVRSRELEQLSRTDGLTGMFNRRYFDESYAREWRRAVRGQSPLSIILFDIDYFKRVNDQYGHPAGDAYLKHIGGIILQVFRRTTDLSARYGGEEFIVLLPESLETAAKRAERFRAAVEQTYILHHGEKIQRTISAGVATMVPGRTDHSKILISRADSALYQSKENHRNKVTVWQER